MYKLVKSAAKMIFQDLMQHKNPYNSIIFVNNQFALQSVISAQLF